MNRDQLRHGEPTEVVKALEHEDSFYDMDLKAALCNALERIADLERRTRPPVARPFGPPDTMIDALGDTDIHDD